MDSKPHYVAANLHPAYELRYGWSAWPSSTFPDAPNRPLLESISSRWEQDGMRLLESNWSNDLIQITFSAKVDIAPIVVAARAKGRIEHGWRTADDKRVKFSRKVAVRSIGDSTRETIENYVRSQVQNASFADPRFREFMKRFTRCDPTVNLSEPVATLSGRYWYNLHLVLVTADRQMIVDEDELALITDESFRIADRQGYRISVLSVMPDHLHAGLQGRIEDSPQEIALAFMNNLASAIGRPRIWSNNYYVGTFGEYTMHAVR